MRMAAAACLTLASLLLLVTGYLAGALSLSAAEPDGIFVSCGPALFDRPSPLPDPACAAAYAPLPQVSVLLLTAGAVCGLAAIFLTARVWFVNRSPRHQ